MDRDENQAKNQDKSNIVCVKVLLPIAIPKSYTYFVPFELIDEVEFGKRVEVQFGKRKIYAGIIIDCNANFPVEVQPKPILSIVDEVAIIDQVQYDMWKWIAQYYCCTEGEVMNAALPAPFKLSSDTVVTRNIEFHEDVFQLNDKEYMIVEALEVRKQLSLKEIQNIIQQKTVSTLIHNLIKKGHIVVKEELSTGYKPKYKDFISINSILLDNGSDAVFDLVKRSEKQQRILSYLLQDEEKLVTKKEVIDGVNADYSSIKALEKKGLIKITKRKISRIKSHDNKTIPSPQMTKSQQESLLLVDTFLKDGKPVLLHGITGSGKTRIYTECIQTILDKGKQVLYLLPEIALTSQLIHRLQDTFGSKVLAYHSRLSNSERAEIWFEIQKGHPIILGARSSLFLPFSNLGLIIVDEEHDPSFKQQDPAPRYNARDAAVVLARKTNSKIILGSATPSYESYTNTLQGKYGLVEMNKRVTGVELPILQIIDLNKSYKKRQMKEQFSTTLLDEIQVTLDNSEQIIIFQNRRGYAPYMNCKACGNHIKCINCDVSLTYHKFFFKLNCHYCGFTAKVPEICPECGLDHTLQLKGFGTEKIENQLKQYFPDKVIERMDHDTVKTKYAYTNILQRFGDKKIDILVGTQMVTKGLDFDSVGLVSIVNVDNLFIFPDFRSNERGYQLITQVSGRAGRSEKQGKVLLQSFNLSHPVLVDVLANKFKSSFQREMSQRKMFGYPPFNRLIQITLKHKNAKTVHSAAKWYAALLKSKWQKRVKGPAEPYISKIRNFYLREILIKVEKDSDFIFKIKASIMEGIIDLHSKEGMSGVKVNIDIDPY